MTTGEHPEVLLAVKFAVCAKETTVQASNRNKVVVFSNNILTFKPFRQFSKGALIRKVLKERQTVTKIIPA